MKSRAGFAVCALALSCACTAGAAFDLQGHRGARGLRPENTLAGFAHALAIGVTTLELDCASSREKPVVVAGAGPAGLAAAIRLKQVNAELAVCILEKGSEIGAHILSGAVVDPRALDELLPDWRSRGAPVGQPVKHSGS